MNESSAPVPEPLLYTARERLCMPKWLKEPTREKYEPFRIKSCHVYCLRLLIKFITKSKKLLSGKAFEKRSICYERKIVWEKFKIHKPCPLKFSYF